MSKNCIMHFFITHFLFTTHVFKCVIIFCFFSDVCQTTVSMEADAARPGMVSRAPVMGRDTPEPHVTHVRMRLGVFFYYYWILCVHICMWLIAGHVFLEIKDFFSRSTSASDIIALPQKWWRTKKSSVLCVMRGNVEKGKRNAILFN